MDAPPIMEADLVKHAVNFHGRELQKIWESEHHEDDDIVKGGTIDFDFGVYQERQKHLSFQDRGKRLKVQHFIARHAEQLFDASNLPATKTVPQAGKPLAPGEEELFAVLPPYDMFLPLNNTKRLQHFFQCVEPGELLICSITSKSSSGMMLKVLCTDSIPFRYVADLNVKAFCPAIQMPPGGVVTDKKGVSRSVMHNEAVRVELLEVVPDSEKMVVSMLPSRPADITDGTSDAAKPTQLGLVYTEDLPVAYKMCQDRKGESYSELLEHSLGFANPSNTELLATKAGISQESHNSFLKSLRGRFPMDEYFSELRQVQAGKWAFKSVAEGITHFKAGHHSEAFQCLNRALSIDRRNVEGLVARGALYANSGSFKKAIEDFECALKLNPNHQNARKYMGETLVALGRSYEDENKIDEALKAYENCLELVPYHEDAKNSIRYLENKIRAGGNSTAASKMASDPHAINPSAAACDVLLPGAITSLSDALMPAGLTSSKSLEVKATLKQLLKAEQDEKGRSSRSKKKKDRKRKSRRRSRKRRRRDRSSSSSSSSSTASASSSSSSSSSSGSGSSGDRASSHSGSASPHRSSSKKSKGKKHHSKESHREKSLSPLSKRMALMDTSRDSDGLAGLMTQRMSQYNSSAQPYSFEDAVPAVKAASGAGVTASKETEYEQRVRAFLEQTKEDSDYEDKVRKFLEESTKWRKDRKVQEKEVKKKKKKEKNKSKDKEKGKKKKSKDEEKKRKRRGRKSTLSEFAGELGDGSGLAFEGLDEGGRRLVKEALLHKLGKPRHNTVVQGSESSSDDQDDPAGIMFSSLKKPAEKSDLSRMLNEIPSRLDDLGDLKTKLSAYYAKIGKEAGGLTKRGDDKEKKSVSRGVVAYPSPIGKPSKNSNNNAGLSPKLPYMQNMDDEDEIEKRSKMDIFADTPSPVDMGKLVEASNIVSSKWKMQINPSNSKVKRRMQNDKEPWEDTEEKRFIFIKEGREEGEASSGPDDLNSRHRPPTPKHKFNAKEAVYEKYTGFRIAHKDDPMKMDPSSILPAQAPPTPVPAPGKDGAIRGPKTDSESETDPNKKKIKKAKSRSRSKSSTSRSRARSSGSSASGKRRRRSRSGSYRRRSRSGSYRYNSRSRSGSYYSRSRSRSGSYARSRSRSYGSRSRSRSGSREGGRRRSSDYYRKGSRSPDRFRRYDNRGNSHRYPRQRGTYYRPRFQGYNKNPRGGYGSRGRGYNPRGNRPFVHRGRGRGRPRYFHYNRPGGGYRSDHHRRYSDSRDRSRERSYDDRDRDRDTDRDRDRERRDSRRDDDRKSEEPKREREREVEIEHNHEEEEEYVPKSADDYIDRKMFEGKWAEDRDEEKRKLESRREEDIPPPPGTVEPVPENSIEEIDKFLNKAKAQKKEEMKERNKSYKRPIVY